MNFYMLLMYFKNVKIFKLNKFKYLHLYFIEKYCIKIWETINEKYILC